MLRRYIQTKEGESGIRTNEMLKEGVKMCTLYHVILGWSNRGGRDRGDITPATGRSEICTKKVAKPAENRHLVASRRRQHNITMDLKRRECKLNSYRFNVVHIPFNWLIIQLLFQLFARVIINI